MTAAEPIDRRDGFRCTAPGCAARHAALDGHGTLALSGRVPLGLTWTAGAGPAARRFRCQRRL